MSNYYEDDEHPDMETILKRFALWGGIALAIISIYFSYDGADQSISGANPTYTEVANAIMIVMACVITLAQFIFNSDFTKLSTTMKLIGVASYAYSLTTNYWGIEHLFGFHGFVGGAIAAFMDIAPEAFIAWSLDDSMRGDMLGNIGKFITGATGGMPRRKKSNSSKQYTFTPPQTPPAFRPANSPKKGKGRDFYMNQHKPNQPPKDPNRFEGFGE